MEPIKSLVKNAAMLTFFAVVCVGMLCSSAMAQLGAPDNPGSHKWGVVAGPAQAASAAQVQIPALIHFEPGTLNEKSKGKWVTCFIEFPDEIEMEGVDPDNVKVGNIDISTVKLNGVVPAQMNPTDISDYDMDNLKDLMLKFDRSAVQGLLSPGMDVVVTLTGMVSGMEFMGTDNIRVIDPPGVPGNGGNRPGSGSGGGPSSGDQPGTGGDEPGSLPPRDARVILDGTTQAVLAAAQAQIAAIVDFDPNTLNEKSKGKWVTCYIEFPDEVEVVGGDPDDVKVQNIDISTVKLNGTIPAEMKPWEIGDYDMDNRDDLMLKFDRSAVQGLLSPGMDVMITLTGLVAGMEFMGTDSIRVIDPPPGNGWDEPGSGGGGDPGSSGDPGSGGDDPGSLPPRDKEIILMAQPNPFNPSVRIQYEVPQPGRVLMQIVTVSGRVVRTLEDTQRAAGMYFADWDGRDAGGNNVASGLYICRLVVGSKVATGKLALLK